MYQPLNRVPKLKISMIEHISLSFPPHCGIFNSTKRESSAVKFFSPHHRNGWHKLRHWPPGTSKSPFVPHFFAHNSPQKHSLTNSIAYVCIPHSARRLRIGRDVPPAANAFRECSSSWAGRRILYLSLLLPCSHQGENGQSHFFVKSPHPPNSLNGKEMEVAYFLYFTGGMCMQNILSKWVVAKIFIFNSL